MSRDVYFVYESDDDSFLSTKNDGAIGYGCRPAAAKDLTPDRVAEYLDRQAENANMHEFVGVHVGLLALLRQCEVDDIRCDAVMRAILRGGGLPGIEAGGR